MLKTIKTTKQLRLDELIKYIFENNVKNKYFYSEQKKTLEVDMYGKIIPGAHFNKNSIFPVEVEEEITEDTNFKLLIETYYYNGDYGTLEYANCSVNNIRNSRTLTIYALINGKLELIWERDKQ